MQIETDVTLVSHLARLAILGMIARGVAAAAFESSDQFQSVMIIVKRAEVLGEELPVVVEFGDADDMVISEATL